MIVALRCKLGMHFVLWCPFFLFDFFMVNSQMVMARGELGAIAPTD